MFGSLRTSLLRTALNSPDETKNNKKTNKSKKGKQTEENKNKQF
jgi:hypothetical protein